MSNEELSEYSYDDEVADYKTRDEFYPELDNDKVIPIKAEMSLHEVLMDQLSMLALDERGFKIAEQIIGSLDDDGYLRRAMQSIADDLAFKQSMWVEEKEIELSQQSVDFVKKYISDKNAKGEFTLADSQIIELNKKLS